MYMLRLNLVDRLLYGTIRKKHDASGSLYGFVLSRFESRNIQVPISTKSFLVMENLKTQVG